MTQEDSTTSNVDLNLPGIGVKTNWATQYKENFQLLDALLSRGETIPGIEINTAVVAEELGLPEYDDVANAPQSRNRVVYATGDGASAEGIYKHDGGSYSQIGGGLSDGDDFDGQGTASFQNLESVGADVLNSIEVASDSKTIQQAHDALPADGGKLVVDGSYANGDSFPIDITKPCVIEGDGRVGIDGGTNHVFVVDLGSNDPPGVAFKDIRILGGEHGILVVSGMLWTYFENVVVDGVGGVGLRYSDSAGSFIGYTGLNNCTFRNCGDHGMRDIDGTVNSIDIFGCSFSDNGGVGVRWEAGSDAFRMYGGSIEGNGNTGMSLGGLSTGVINGVWFEDNTQSVGNHDILFTDPGELVEVSNCRFGTDQGQPHAITVLDGDLFRVKQCRFVGYSSQPIRLDSGADIDIGGGHVYSGDLVVDNGATRPRYNGVIGGGELGGVDVGSVTGATEGDMARSDGTTGDADALYILTANGDWQALHDPTTTITPA